MLSIAETTVIVMSAGLTAFFAIRFLMPHPHSRGDGAMPQLTDSLALLFDNGVLHHGTLPALNRFALLPGTHVWDDLRDTLLPRFPEFPETAGAGASGSMALLAQDPKDPAEVEVSVSGVWPPPS